MSGSDQENYARNKARVAELELRKARIRELNDHLRRRLAGGYIMITPGVRAFGDSFVGRVLHTVQQEAEFTADNDPYEEHDFGALDVSGHRVFWKIDYFSPDLESASPDPADPEVTARVLTIMLSSEY